MPGGSKDLRKIQAGQEVTAGTAVAATALLRGMGTIEPKQEVVEIDEDVGIVGKTDRRLVTRKWAELQMPAVSNNFEQGMYPFEAGVEKVVTPVADGAGTGKIWTYDAPTTVQNPIQTLTLEGGDDIQAYEIPYAFVEQITLAGDSEGPLTIASNWTSRPMVTSTFTGAIAIPAVEDINFNSGRLFIDNLGGTFGTTEVSGMLRAMSLRWTTGLKAWWAVDGSDEFQAHKFAGETEEIQIDLTYEHLAGAVTEFAQYESNAIRKLQLLFEGSALGTPGTDYTNKSLVINIMGWYDTWGALGDLEGNNIVDLTMKIKYNISDAEKAQVIYVNEVTPLP